MRSLRPTWIHGGCELGVSCGRTIARSLESCSNSRRGAREFASFHSAVHQEEREYDAAQLERAHLSPQTRVYVRDDESEAWSAGRVIDYDRSAGDNNLAYVVRSPGRDDVPVLESELEARCFAPTVDPTDALAGGGIESQYFSDRRLAALRASMAQQRAAATANGLVSASVRLLPHQLHVVRRLREDPVQRYLLRGRGRAGKDNRGGRRCCGNCSTTPPHPVWLLLPRPRS